MTITSFVGTDTQRAIDNVVDRFIELRTQDGLPEALAIGIAFSETKPPSDIDLLSEDAAKEGKRYLADRMAKARLLTSEKVTFA